MYNCINYKDNKDQDNKDQDNTSKITTVLI